MRSKFNSQMNLFTSVKSNQIARELEHVSQILNAAYSDETDRWN
jgi:hypothetical protein